MSNEPEINNIIKPFKIEVERVPELPQAERFREQFKEKVEQTQQPETSTPQPTAPAQQNMPPPSAKTEIKSNGVINALENLFQLGLKVAFDYIPDSTEMEIISESDQDLMAKYNAASFMTSPEAAVVLSHLVTTISGAAHSVIHKSGKFYAFAKKHWFKGKDIELSDKTKDALQTLTNVKSEINNGLQIEQPTQEMVLNADQKQQ